MDAEKLFLDSFIECYKRNRCIWDVKNSDYVDRRKKYAAYSELLNILKMYKSNSDINDVKKKINTLRSSYRRELKKIKASETSGGSSDNIYTPSVWWFNKLDFLQDFEKPKVGISTIATPSSEEIKTTFQPSRKRKVERFLAKAVEHIDHSRQNLAKDDADIYSQSWAAMFRKLSAEQQMFAKFGIEKLLVDGQLGKLTYESVLNVGAHARTTPKLRKNNYGTAQPQLQFVQENRPIEIRTSPHSSFSSSPTIITPNPLRTSNDSRTDFEEFKFQLESDSEDVASVELP